MAFLALWDTFGIILRYLPFLPDSACFFSFLPISSRFFKFFLFLSISSRFFEILLQEFGTDCLGLVYPSQINARLKQKRYFQFKGPYIFSLVSV